MTAVSMIYRVGAGLCLVVVMIPLVGVAEERDPAEEIGGPLTGSVVLNAPFSADATTSVRLTFRDGTKLDQSTTARYYRDTIGRVRVELPTDGIGAANTPERHFRTIVAPALGIAPVWTLDPVRRTAHILPRPYLAMVTGGANEFAVPIGDGFITFRRARDLLTPNRIGDPYSYNVEQTESLGSRRIAGVDTMGSRVTMTIPAGYWQNDKPIELVDERWESPELKLLIAAHFRDSRTGDVEYRLSNIRRVEPSSDLLGMPADYTANHTSETRNGDGWPSMRADLYTANAPMNRSRE